MGTGTDDSAGMASHMLVGRELPGGWTVTEKIERPPDATGGHFSVGYWVQRGSDVAYLKALDYSAVLSGENVAQMLEAVTSAFNHEAGLLTRCSGMDRIVRILAHDECDVPEAVGVKKVSYLVFEKADGDIRGVLGSSERAFDLAWRFRLLHHAATGLWQMHNAGIAHQDVKPSNMLLFGDDIAKIGDLGRSSMRGSEAPHDEEPFAGDRTYAPPELLYGEISADWGARRQACDLYLLASLAVFVFSETTLTASVKAHLAAVYWPEHWTADYASVLPYVRIAFDDVLESFAPSVPSPHRETMITLVRALGDPDPALRGHPNTRANNTRNPYSLERFVSEFDLLVHRTGMYRKRW